MTTGGDVTRWWWIRHAPVPQLSDQIYGNLDPDCDVSDARRFAVLARRLPPDALWIVTDLRRTRQTAEAVGKAGYPLRELAVEAAFGEQNFGALHGVRHADHNARRTDAFRRIWPMPPDTAPHGGESFVAVMERVAQAVDRLSAAHRGRDIVCVAHGGTIRAAIGQALSLAPRDAVAFSVDPLSLTRLHRRLDAAYGSPRWLLLGINERSLSEEE
jgi:alpha-ribazole phosphatase